jgi:hypothetical protein
MDPAVHLLAQLLAYAGLLAATVEYCEVMRRRQLQRVAAADVRAIRASGLQALVRVFLADSIEDRHRR